MSLLYKARFKPALLITLINIIGFLLLFIIPSDNTYSKDFLYVGLILCVINLATFCILYFFNLGDVYLYLLTAMLMSIGTIMLFRLNFAYGKAQILWYIIGISVFFASYFIFRFFKKWNKLLYFYIGLTVFAYLLTLVLGHSESGSKNWISIGKYSVQPSEFIKILYCFALACFMSEKPKKDSFFTRTFIGISYRDIAMAAYVYMCMGFFVLQREWGTALLFFMIYFTVIFIYDKNYKIILINIAIAVLMAYAGYKFTPHIKNRVSIWLDPWSDIMGKGFQITQSLFAIASGGYFGTGLGQGSPYSIPEVHTDFIFSAICEEMGVFTGIAIILIYFLFSYRGAKIALNTKNEFCKALAILLTVSFAYQTFIIVGGVIKLIPLTGITMPFVSYGGSSLVSCFISMGILVAISYTEK